MSSSRILLIDNFDSFTFNVMHGLVEAGADVDVRRADALTVGVVETFDPAMIVISPGPGRPEDARLSLEVCRRFGGRVPILGRPTWRTCSWRARPRTGPCSRW